MKPEHDNSLRGAALRRAKAGEPPRTLTPWEWQEWYAEHGHPPSRADDKAPSTDHWLLRIFKRQY